MTTGHNVSRRRFLKKGCAVATGVRLSMLATPALCLATTNGNTILIDPETFEDLGGWVIDTQSIDQLGSAYLLAHGAGFPVGEASADFEVPKTAAFRIWVRTRDWCHPHKPGRFQLRIADHVLPTEFGTGKADWHWQEGGTVKLQAGSVNLTLKDLTGFEGRCEAIILSSDPRFVPPEGLAGLRSFRRKALGLPVQPAMRKRYDLVVAGGGIAGLCAAIAAARSGVRVALVHNRPVLGGNNSSEIRVKLSDIRNHELYPNIGNVVKALEHPRGDKIKENDKEAWPEWDHLKMDRVKAEDNIDLFLSTHIVGVQMDGSTIRAAVAIEPRTGTELLFEAPLFADCTGDGNLGVLAGAEFRMGREAKAEFGEPRAPEKADKQVLGSTLHWFSEKTQKELAFPSCPGALQFNEKSCQNAVRSAWNWEGGFLNNNATETESIRDHFFRAIYGNWDFQKNSSQNRKKYENLKLHWVAYNLGKRESRRLVGDLIFTQKDIESGKMYPDAAVGSKWGIDIHGPDPQNARFFPDGPFRSKAYHIDKKSHPVRYLPYRCFYSRNINNLFMAGRNVSQSHVSMAMFRTQRTTGMMGEVVGIAAAICISDGVLPREVYSKRLQDLKKKLRKGV